MTAPASLPACLDDSPHPPLLSIIGTATSPTTEYAIVRRRGSMNCRLVSRRLEDESIVVAVKAMGVFFSPEDHAAVAMWLRTGSIVPVE